MGDASTFHLFIYRKIRKKARGRFFVPHSSVLSILKRFLPYTPRVLYYPIIKDLEKDKLIKRIDKTKYEVIGGKADNELNKFNCPM